MRPTKRIFVSVFALLVLLLLSLCADIAAPQTREARATRLIRANLSPGSSERQVSDFLLSQDAAYGWDPEPGHRAAFGRFPVVPPSAWSSYANWMVPNQWMESYDRGVGSYIALNKRGRMVSLKVYPPGAGPFTKPWRDLP